MSSDHEYDSSLKVTIRVGKFLVFCLFAVIFGLIVESVVRYIVPQRDSRKYVLIFYSLSMLLTLACLTESVYYVIKPEAFLYSCDLH